MNNKLFKPTFELLFSVGVIAALGVPQLILAQDKKAERKEVSIIIKNNDTTFNGKSLKSMQGTEKQEALAEINKTVKPNGTYVRKFTARRNPWGSDSANVSVFSFRYDSLDRNVDKGERMPRLPDMNLRLNGPHEGAYRGGKSSVRNVTFMRRGNSQSFEFNNTGKDGISTHVSYLVRDAMPEDAKSIAAVTTTDLELQDLTLTPQFSAGKTILSFTLPAKTPADVQFTDSEGKVIWKDKVAATSFSKAFAWNLNGIYYLVVKQGGKSAVKRIVKE